MKVFKVNVVAGNPKEEGLATMPVEALVDTGSELSWLPAEGLRQIGVTPLRQRVLTTDNRIVEREVGHAMLRVNDRQTVDEVVFAEAGDVVRLGVRTLDVLGMLDDPAHCFVSLATLASFSMHKLQKAA